MADVTDITPQLGLADLADYRVEERAALAIKVGDYNVYSSPAPSGGPELLTLLAAMERMVGEQGNTAGSGVFDTPGYRARLGGLLARHKI